LRTKSRSGKKKHIGAIIGIIILAGVISTAIYLYNEQKASVEKYQWIISGPFAINKNQYKLGENIFMVVSNLKPTDVGQIVITDPKGDTYSSIPFNGTMKSSFKQFFKPNTQRGLALCNPTDLVGQWNIIFEGVSYKSIPFKIVNEWIEGSQSEVQPVPKGLAPC
jgi:hypothetical protein